MKVLMLGDICGKAGRKVVSECLASVVREHGVDFVVANGDNLAHGSGITPKTAKEVLGAGVHVLTNGNHVWDNEMYAEVFGDNELREVCLRPENYYGKVGKGYGVYMSEEDIKVGVINIAGSAHINMRVECPYQTVDKLVAEMHKMGVKIVLVDLHAETTSEKVAMGFYLDGKVSAVVGTHTHIPTADARVLPEGTGYITDLGMAGALNSVLGIKKEVIIKKETTQMPQKFEQEEERPYVMAGAVFEIDDHTGKCKHVQQIIKTIE